MARKPSGTKRSPNMNGGFKEVGIQIGIQFALYAATALGKLVYDGGKPIVAAAGKRVSNLFTKKSKDSQDKPATPTNTSHSSETSEETKGAAKASTVDDILHEEHKDRTDLVGGLIAEDTINVLVGTAKTGKSRLAVTLAIDLAAGKGPRVLNMHDV